jgi:aminopeptidase YwaD
MKRLLIIILLLVHFKDTDAQFLDYAKPIMDTLCSPQMHGRGYVQDGVNKAANYLATKMKEIGLKNFDNTYFQDYAFPINTIPIARCTLDNKEYFAGEHFLVDAGCKDIKGTFNLLPFSYTNEVDRQLLFLKLRTGFADNEALLMKNVEDGRQFRKFVDTLDSMGFKIPFIVKSVSKKLLWTTSQSVEDYPMITFPDTIINQKDKITIDIDSKLIEKYACKNLIGYLPGKKKNTKGYIVFTAHYDHLGMLGEKAFFPGASDNASGTSMILAIAKYFSEHKVDYPVVFMLFSGEEVGLLGSRYFVENPLFDLKKIRMLINVDIMGSGEAGITVVNGEVYKQEFDALVQLNKEEALLPEVKIRGKAANSDHYFFSESGVPSFFIYSNGGPGYYHDVWDKPNTLTLKNFDQVGQLLIKFANQLK